MYNDQAENAPRIVGVNMLNITLQFEKVLL